MPRIIVLGFIKTTTSKNAILTIVFYVEFTNINIRQNPNIIPGMLKNKVYTVIKVIKELFLRPKVLRTPNSYLLSSTSVCMRENINMKLKKQMKNMTVAKTLLSINSITYYASI